MLEDAFPGACHIGGPERSAGAERYAGHSQHYRPDQKTQARDPMRVRNHGSFFSTWVSCGSSVGAIRRTTTKFYLQRLPFSTAVVLLRKHLMSVDRTGMMKETSGNKENYCLFGFRRGQTSNADPSSVGESGSCSPLN